VSYYAVADCKQTPAGTTYQGGYSKAGRDTCSTWSKGIIFRGDQESDYEFAGRRNAAAQGNCCRNPTKCPLKSKCPYPLGPWCFVIKKRPGSQKDTLNLQTCKKVSLCRKWSFFIVCLLRPVARLFATGGRKLDSTSLGQLRSSINPAGGLWCYKQPSVARRRRNSPLRKSSNSCP